MAAPAKSPAEICCHKANSKGAFKGMTKESFKILDGQKRIDPSICPLCFVYGFWGRLGDNEAFKVPQSVEVGRTSYTRGYDAAIDHYKMSFQRPTLSKDLGIAPATQLSFAIEQKQNGETYHGLVCALLCGNVTLNTKKASPAQKDLLRSCGLSKSCGDGPNSNSKAEATATIARAFENAEDQMVLFQALRDHLDHSSWAEVGPFGEYQGDYMRPSYCGKFWLNRFLSFTASISKAKERPIRKLPKENAVAHIACIIVRKDPEARDGRTMTAENLASCVDAIGLCNQRCREKGQASFSHILIFGDITSLDGVPVLDGVKLMFVTSPFAPIKSNDPLAKFWSAFHDKSNFEMLPKELKYLGFFLALQRRYGNKLSYIGFRSGTLDGPAFLGSPTFSLDDTSSPGNKDVPWKDKVLGWREAFGDARYLFQDEAAKGLDSERMAQISSRCCTFIRITVPGPDSKGQVVLKPSRALCNQEKKLEGLSPVDHLAAALYAFAVAQPGEDPFWTKRNHMMKDAQGSKILEDLITPFL